MKKALERFDEAEKMIQDFATGFYKKFGFWPVIRFNTKSFFIPKLTLKDIHDTVNSIFEQSFPDVYTSEGIFVRTRKQLPITYRHIFFKIARETGYTFKNIGEYGGYNHATIVHAVTRINNLLEVGDVDMSRNYNLVKNEIENRRSNAGDVQHDDQREPNTESVLFSLLQEREHQPIKHQHPSGDESVGNNGVHK